MADLLREISAETARRLASPGIPEHILEAANEIVQDVRIHGHAQLREYAHQFDGLDSQAGVLIERTALLAMLESLPAGERAVLERTAERIRKFAKAQRESLQDLDIPIPGGHAGHKIVPIERAGCYAPGGRHPLISSALMTIIAAREAGVKEVYLATPTSDRRMLGAAAIAGADGVLLAGGAHAVAALAYGWEGFDPVDIIAGPGNVWVTAAKQIVSRDVGIDMLAGPSEVLVVADETADPAIVAADLLAQAEHDSEAIVTLIVLNHEMIASVERALADQLQDLPTRITAEMSIMQGRVIVAHDRVEAVEIANRFAPEHLELHVNNPDEMASQITHCGAVFLGEGSAEVFGDYGAGPNHVLPTAGTARRTGGLSVFTFLRIRTWMSLDGSVKNEMTALISDVATMARMEGLEAHARAAEIRITRKPHA